MTREENIRAILECNFSESKEELIDIAVKNITALSQEPTDENLHREREQAYMQGYEDASKKYRQEPKILDTIDFAIDASNGDTNYFVGFRNGLRYAKSLIDGEEPQFESCVEQKSGKWIKKDYWKPLPFDTDPLDWKTYDETTHSEKISLWYCSECDAVKGEIEPTARFCENCGAKMESEARNEDSN